MLFAHQTNFDAPPNHYASAKSEFMKVLFDHFSPFFLAHGGFQIQIEQTLLAVLECGVQAEFLEWWNPDQKGDIIHYFGRPAAAYIKFAHGKGCKIVIEELLSAAGSRSRSQLAWQRSCIKLFRRFLPSMFTERMMWESYRLADACVANTPWEAHLMNYLFDAPKERIHVVPNGVEDVFFNTGPAAREKWLVCTATITERKRVLEMAEAAVQAQTPVWVIGKAYADSDPYAQKFFAVAGQHPQTIRYEGAIQDRASLARIYRQARGFVLLSTMETRSLAAEEAAACECPLLLSDLPWARTTFGSTVRFCPVTKSVRQTAASLRAFYEVAPELPAPPKPATWLEIGSQFKKIYRDILSTSR